jgi:hypothetical protein
VTFIEFILGCFLHFLYDIFPNVLIGLISPINESIFEHLKIAFYPMLMINIIILIIKKDKNMIFPMYISMATSMISIIMIYYTYVYALDILSLAVDITLLFVSDLIGNLLGYHFYKYSHYSYIIGVFLIGITIIVISYLTYYPLDISLFV